MTDLDFTYSFGPSQELLYLNRNKKYMVVDFAKGDFYPELDNEMIFLLEKMRNQHQSKYSLPFDTGTLNSAILDKRKFLLNKWRHDTGSSETRFEDWEPVISEETFSPKFITIYPASKCNLKCRYCYNQKGTFGYSNVSMSKDNAKKTVLWLKKFLLNHNRPLVQIGVSGGEPLLNPDITLFLCEQLLSLNNDKNYPNIRIALNTNGTLPDFEKLLSLFKVYPKHVYIEISLDGNRERHNRMRKFANGKGSFDTVLKAIHKIEKLKLMHRVLAVLPYPYEAIETSGELTELGITSFIFNHLDHDIFGEKKDTPNQFPFDFKLWKKQLLKYMIKNLENKKNNPDALVPFDREFAVSSVSKILKHKISPFACNTGRFLIGISPHGEIFPCDRFFGKKAYILGNVEQGIEKYALQKFFDELNTSGRMSENHPECKICYARWRCRGGCYAANYDRGNQLNVLNKQKCKIRREQFVLDLYYFGELCLQG